MRHYKVVLRVDRYLHVVTNDTRATAARPGGLEEHDVGPRAESAGDRAAAGGTEAALDPRVSFRRDGVVTQFAVQPQAVRRNDEDGSIGRSAGALTIAAVAVQHPLRRSGHVVP